MVVESVFRVVPPLPHLDFLAVLVRAFLSPVPVLEYAPQRDWDQSSFVLESNCCYNDRLCRYDSVVVVVVDDDDDGNSFD